MAKGTANPNWRGGKYADKRGYIYVLAPDHPNAVFGGKRYVSEHRLVMSNHLGRPLTNREIVHHINGNKSDNRLENLVIVTRSAHVAEHISGEKHHLWKGGAAVLECKQCGKEFSARDHNRNERAKYCSRKCYANSMRAEPRICQTCGKQFQPVNPGTTPGKYCSRRCAGIGLRKAT